MMRHGPVGNGIRGECVLEIESKSGVLFGGYAFFVLEAHWEGPLVYGNGSTLIEVSVVFECAMSHVFDTWFPPRARPYRGALLEEVGP